MKSMKKIGSRQCLCTLSLLLMSVFLLVATTVFSASEVPAPATAKQETEARGILSNMADVLSQAAGFSVTIRSSYDAIQQDGQRIEFGEKRTVLLQRPDRLRVDVERSDGDQGLVIFNGQTITAFKAEDNVYAQVEKAGSVDNAIVHLVRNLQTPFPLARMFLTTLSRDMPKWIETVSYVEENTLTTPPTDHLAGRAADVDFQIWVAQGKRPLPQRIVLTYRSEPGQPQFRADFIDWTLTPETDAASFIFTPPEKAEQILFLAPVQQNSPPVEQEGGKP
jgi:hypothetical protein